MKTEVDLFVRDSAILKDNYMIFKIIFYIIKDLIKVK